MSKIENSGQTLKYKSIIIVVSIVIPLVVLILFNIRITSLPPLTFLPPIYATINGITAILLIAALYSMKNKKITQHELLMKTSIFLSLVFLVMYILYHMTTDPTPYGGEGIIRTVYFFILISHIALSIFIVPMVLVTYVRAISNMFDKHKKIARVTFPIWLYIALIQLIVAYIGGKNVNGCKDVILMLNKIKTTNGITIETTIIKDLYFKV
jgi:putative membrane protein